jgi:hypothetical protein
MTMDNRYLEKIAGWRTGLKEGFKNMTPLEHLGFGMSGTGLVMGASNLGMGLKREGREERKVNMEEQSLSTLKGIHKTLENQS